jgi:hypothetical protein
MRGVASLKSPLAHGEASLTALESGKPHRSNETTANHTNPSQSVVHPVVRPVW